MSTGLSSVSTGVSILTALTLQMRLMRLNGLDTTPRCVLP
jgi:hypothetical protein